MSRRRLDAAGEAILLVDGGLPPALCRAALADIAPDCHAHKSLRLISCDADQAVAHGVEIFGAQMEHATFQRMRRLTSRLPVRVALHPYSVLLSHEWLRTYARQFFSLDCMHVTSMGHMGSGRCRLPGALGYTLAVGVATEDGRPDVRCSVYRERPDIWVRCNHFLRHGDLEHYGGTSAAVCVAGAHSSHVVARLRRHGLVLSALQLRLLMKSLARPQVDPDWMRLLEPVPLPVGFEQQIRCVEIFADRLDTNVSLPMGQPSLLAVSCFRSPTRDGVLLGEVPYSLTCSGQPPIVGVQEGIYQLASNSSEPVSISVHVSVRCHISIVVIPKLESHDE